ncbi:hypothetical protein BJX62DRAFT_206273 [Aspergillus germanicus]
MVTGTFDGGCHRVGVLSITVTVLVSWWLNLVARNRYIRHPTPVKDNLIQSTFISTPPLI